MSIQQFDTKAGSSLQIALDYGLIDVTFTTDGGNGIAYLPAFGGNEVKVLLDNDFADDGPAEDSIRVLFNTGRTEVIDFTVHPYNEGAAAYPDGPVQKVDELNAQLQLVERSDATVFATDSGNWSDQTIWSIGFAPQAGDTVVIPEGLEVVYDAKSADKLEAIRVEGTLSWRADVDTPLRAETFLSVPGSEVETGNSPTAVINAEIVVRSTTPDDNSEPIYGTEGDDIINLGDENTRVYAGPGDDFVYVDGSRAGNNIIDLGSGNDKFWAAVGNNTITGSGNNEIGIGAGNKTVSAGGGDDFVYTVNSGGGTYTLNLGEGANKVWVENGDYIINTGSGDDEIGLGTGTDTVDAGDGANIIYLVEPSNATTGEKDILTGKGNDYVQTGAGNDYIDAGTGLNTLLGGYGSDIFVVRPGAYNYIVDYEPGDKIALDGVSFKELRFYQGTGDNAADAFVFVGYEEAIAHVANATVAELDNKNNFIGS